MSPRPRRKQYLINPSLQLKVIGYLALVSLTSLSILSFFFHRQQKQITELVMLSHFRPTAASYALSAVTTKMLWLAIIILGINTIFFFLVGLWVTHRMAGPIHRLKLDLAAYLQGQKIGPIRFRQGDEFTDLLDLVNQVLKKQSGHD